MAHELAQNADGSYAFAYVGDAAWHRLGTQLDSTADMAEWTKAAGFAHEVLRAPATFQCDGEILRVPGKDVLFRSDNKLPMSVVSDSYKVVQPREVLAYFADLADRAGFKLETAGTLFGGRQYWGLAQIGDEACVKDPNDRMRGRLLMATSVDLSLPTIFKFLYERVVCNNTLTWGLSEKGGTVVKVRHRSVLNADDVNDKLGIMAKEQFSETMAHFRSLAETPMSDLDMTMATMGMFDDLDDMTPEQLMKLASTKPVERIINLTVERAAIGHDLSGSEGTAWGWLNGVTQFVDHEGGGRTADAVVSRAWFGEGDKLKQRAFNFANDFMQTGDVEKSLANLRA